jgi:hypothetical protein
MMVGAQGMAQSNETGPTLRYLRLGEEFPAGARAAFLCFSNSTAGAILYHNHPPAGAPDYVVDLVTDSSGAHTNLFFPDVRGGAQSVMLAPGGSVCFLAGAGLNGQYRVGVVYVGGGQTGIVWSALVKLPPDNPPAVQVPPRPAAAYYPGLGGQHWVALALDRGARVKLEDGSVWEISRAYWAQTTFWLATEKITVANGSQPGYPYTLTNVTKGNTVDARLVSP